MTTPAEAAPTTVAELLQRIQTAWAALQDLVAPLSEAQMVTSGPPDGWAVKDHLVHIAEWERATTFVLRGQPQARGFGVDVLPNDVDALNAILYERSRATPLADVTDRARVAHAELLEEIHKLSDADLARTRAEYGPEPELADRPDATVIRKIAGDSYEHYADHVVWIGELLGNLTV